MFPYHGWIAGLRQELEQYREPLEGVYANILGEERFAALREAEATLLSEASFFEDDEVFEQHGTECPKVVANRFIAAKIVTGVDWLRCNAEGGFEAEEVCAAPGFILSEAGYQNNLPAYEGWMPGYLGSYLHLYNQFALFAIQRFAMLIAADLLCHFLDPEVCPTPQNFDQLIQAYPGTVDEKMAAAALASWGVRMASHCDVYGEYLDYWVFRMLGFVPPESFLLYTAQTRREVVFLALSIGRGFPVELGGDILGYPVDESVVVFEEWAERLLPANPWQKAFVESVQVTKMSKVPLHQLVH